MIPFADLVNHQSYVKYVLQHFLINVIPPFAPSYTESFFGDHSGEGLVQFEYPIQVVIYQMFDSLKDLLIAGLHSAIRLG